VQPQRGVIGIHTDRELFIWALEHITEGEFKCEVIRPNAGADSPDTKRAGSTDSPSAIIVDIQSGVFELIRKLSVECQRVPVIVWQRSRANEPSLKALDWGAAGVLHDNSSPEDVLACLKSVTQGFAWIPNSVAQAASRSRRCHLSRREEQLIRLVVQGLRNKEIAYALKISEGTVKVYFSRLFQKLGVADRYELALLGLRHCVPDSVLPDKESGARGEYDPLNWVYVQKSAGFESVFSAGAPSNIPRL
jgi:two-component system nitrate/nitrite response regulator NarP